MRSWYAVLAVVAVTCLTACDSADSRTTARVDRLQAEHACLVPEDSSQSDLEGCFRVSDADLSKLRVGACVSVVVPNQLDAETREKPLSSIKVLDRRCHR